MAAQRLQDIIELYRFGETATTFTSSCNLIYSDKTVHIIGLGVGITRADWRELKQHLKTQGITSATWERRTPEQTINKTFRQ